MRIGASQPRNHTPLENGSTQPAKNRFVAAA